MACDVFDGLQTLIDNDVLSDDALREVLEKIVDNDGDADEVKRAVLMLWLLKNGDNVQPDDVTQERYDTYGLLTFSAGGAEYAVGTDDECDEACKEAIEQSAWAFRPSFLAGETGIDEDVFTALADKCEGANDAVLSLIKGTCGFEDFADSAMSADGRGNFLSSYDGEENDYHTGKEWFHIYRVN